MSRTFNAFLIKRRRMKKVEGVRWILEFLRAQRESTKLILSVRRFRNAGECHTPRCGFLFAPRRLLRSDATTQS